MWNDSPLYAALMPYDMTEKDPVNNVKFTVVLTGTQNLILYYQFISIYWQSLCLFKRNQMAYVLSNPRLQNFP